MRRIGCLLVKLWAYCLSISPFWLLYLRSDFYFFMVYHVVHYRRKVVRQNLLRSFPEKGLKEIKAIEKRFYHNLCDQVVETCKLMRMSVDDMDPPGWPDFAAHTILRISRRTCVEISWS